MMLVNHRMSLYSVCFQKENLLVAVAAIRLRLIIVAGLRRDLFIVKVVIWGFKVFTILLEDFQKDLKLVIEQECLLWFRKDW